MKFSLACGDVMPGCVSRFESSTKEDLLDQVASHAASDHGTEVTPGVLRAVESKIDVVLASSAGVGQRKSISSVPLPSVGGSVGPSYAASAGSWSAGSSSLEGSGPASGRSLTRARKHSQS